MKKALLIIFGFLIIIFFTAVIAVPLLFKDKIVAKVKTTINENLTAKVDFGEFDLSLIKTFPNLSFSLNDLKVIGTDSFANDTLANIHALTVVVDIWSVIKGGEIKINSFTLEEPSIYAHVLKSGKANWDITRPDTSQKEETTGESGSFKMALKKYGIEKGNIIYNDESLGFYLALNNFNHVGKGDFTQDIFTLQTESNADALTISYGGVTYISKAKLKAYVPLEMNLPLFKFTFSDNEFALNELFIKFSGFIAMPKDDIDMDIKFDAQKSEFKNFLSMIPAIYASDFSKLTASGKFGFSGYAKGTYNDKSLPGFGIKLAIENGAFKYPDLPASVDHVQLNTEIKNADGNPDHTIIDVSKFHVELAKESFDAKLHVETPVSDPALQMMLKGKIDLDKLSSIIPLKDMKIGGLIMTDLTAAGKLSSIEKQHYEEFKAAGQVNLSRFSYEAKDQPKVLISQAIMTFSPRNISLSGFNARIGKSDINASGSLSNYIGYVMKGSTIVGKLDISSSMLDLNELMPKTEGTTQTPDTAKMQVIEVPGNIDFTLTSSFKKINYTNLVIDDLQGQVVVKDKKISINAASLKTLDALIKMDAVYNTAEIKKPSVAFNLNIKNMNIQKAFNTFNTVQKLAPIGKYTNGNFSSSLTFNSILTPQMSPDLKTISGKGTMEIPQAKVEGFEPLNKLADALKMDKFKKMEVSNLKINFSFENGRVKVEPFDIKQGNINVNVGGSNGFDQTIDYIAKINLPADQLGSATGNLLKGLPGAPATMPARINVNALIGGLVTKPTVKLDFKDITNTAKDVLTNVVDAGKKEIEKKAAEALKNAKAEARMKADQIMANAQKEAAAIRNSAAQLADKTKTEGYAAAQKIEAEASNPISKIAAKKVADKMRKETDDKTQKIRNEADSKAQAILNAAQEQSKKILGGQ